MLSREGPRAWMSQELDRARSRATDADRVPLFCGSDLAARIERAEAQLMAEVTEAARGRRADGGGFVIPVAGGVATFAEEGSPYNKIAGLGFGGLPDAAVLDEIERAFAGQGVAAQVEVASLADPALVDTLTDRGYRLAAFENVLGRDTHHGIRAGRGARDRGTTKPPRRARRLDRTRRRRRRAPGYPGHTHGGISARRPRTGRA